MSEHKVLIINSRRAATLLLTACLLLSLGAVAYAAGWFGLKGATVSGESLADQYDDGHYTGQGKTPATVITLSGFEGMPEFQAAQEWRTFYNDYVANNYNGDRLHQTLDAWGEEHRDAYTELYTPALSEKFRSICEKYGLTARSRMVEREDDAAYSALAQFTGLEPFLSDSGRDRTIGGSFCLYDDGSFVCDDC